MGLIRETEGTVVGVLVRDNESGVRIVAEREERSR